MRQFWRIVAVVVVISKRSFNVLWMFEVKNRNFTHPANLFTIQMGLRLKNKVMISLFLVIEGWTSQAIVKNNFYSLYKKQFLTTFFDKLAVATYSIGTFRRRPICSLIGFANIAFEWKSSYPPQDGQHEVRSSALICRWSVAFEWIHLRSDMTEEADTA